MAFSRNSKFIHASPGEIYRAFTDPESLVVWQAPGNMTAKVHHFDLRVGGGYEMSLFYPISERKFSGKTEEREDRFTSRFVALDPPVKIVQAVTFDSSNPAFAGEMIMEVMLQPSGKGTNVVIQFNNIPPGIKPKDNEAGTESSLNKLAEYVERNKSM